jgi:hypothetical protein
VEKGSGDTSCGRSTGIVVGLFLVGWSCLPQLACSGPISTMRSPYHLRTVEVRNATDQPRILKIEPTASQHLGAATTFTGVLRPGETKSLYLYHGFEYDFRILETSGFDQLTHRAVQVDRDSGLVYAGDSLLLETALAAGPAQSQTSFSDSLQAADPFGLHAGGRIQPDTARGQAIPTSARQAIDRERRERQGKLQTGVVP